MNKNTVQKVFQCKGWQVHKRPVGFRPRIQAIQKEFYSSAFRRKLYTSLEQLHADADESVRSQNEDLY